MKGIHNPLYPDIPLWLRITEPMMLADNHVNDFYKASKKRKRTPVVGWNGNGIIKHFDSFEQASREAGCHPATILRAVKRCKKVGDLYYVLQKSIV